MGEWFFDTFFGWIYDIFYTLQKSICYLLDFIRDIFCKLAGIETVKIDGGEEEILSHFILSPAIRNAFLDELYEKSKRGCMFADLIPVIVSEENIKLAYRNIKKNKGSKTPGTDGKTIADLEKWQTEALIKHIQRKYLKNLCLDSKQRQKLNKYRQILGLAEI